MRQITWVPPRHGVLAGDAVEPSAKDASRPVANVRNDKVLRASQSLTPCLRHDGPTGDGTIVEQYQIKLAGSDSH